MPEDMRKPWRQAAAADSRQDIALAGVGGIALGSLVLGQEILKGRRGHEAGGVDRASILRVFYCETNHTSTGLKPDGSGVHAVIQRVVVK